MSDLTTHHNSVEWDSQEEWDEAHRDNLKALLVELKEQKMGASWEIPAYVERAANRYGYIAMLASRDVPFQTDTIAGLYWICDQEQENYPALGLIEVSRSRPEDKQLNFHLYICSRITPE